MSLCPCATNPILFTSTTKKALSAQKAKRVLTSKVFASSLKGDNIEMFMKHDLDFRQVVYYVIDNSQPQQVQWVLTRDHQTQAQPL